MIENNPVNNPSHYTNAPFECFELTREYPFAGGNAIKYVFRHRAKNGVEDLKKAAWYLDHATCDELRPRADRHDMTDFGYRCGLVFSKAMAGDERDLDSLGATVWRRMPLFMAGRVSSGLEATPTATRRACAMLRILQHADWQGMAPFWKGMWELAHGYDSGLTRARRAVTRRISLMESPLTDDELLLLDGWSPTPTALWRLKARGSIDY